MEYKTVIIICMYVILFICILTFIKFYINSINPESHMCYNRAITYNCYNQIRKAKGINGTVEDINICIINAHLI